MRAAGGRLLWLGLPSLDCFWNIVLGTYGHPGDIRFMFFAYFRALSKKDVRAETSRRTVRKSCQDLAYDTGSGPQT